MATDRIKALEDTVAKLEEKCVTQEKRLNELWEMMKAMSDSRRDRGSDSPVEHIGPSSGAGRSRRKGKEPASSTVGRDKVVHKEANFLVELQSLAQYQEELITDDARNSAYHEAINFKLPHHVKDKIVIEVDCGTGLFSIICAHAGAIRVIALESGSISAQARQNVQNNNLGHIIQVTHSLVEDYQNGGKVDCIICDWMEHMLPIKGKLQKVIIARDRWLKSTGILMPSSAKLYMAPAALEGRYDQLTTMWKREGMWYDLSCVAFRNPYMEEISQDSMIAPAIVIMEVDCYTITADKLRVLESQFDFKSTKPGLWKKMRSTPVPANAVTLSTAPGEEKTHWKQLVVFLEDTLIVDEGQHINGVLRVVNDEDFPGSRATIRIKYRVDSGEQHTKRAVFY